MRVADPTFYGLCILAQMQIFDIFKFYRIVYVKKFDDDRVDDSYIVSGSGIVYTLDDLPNPEESVRFWFLVI